MTQENWISAPNKHIEEYLDYYFDGKKKFEYAVLLNGAWGSGKTWFVKQYLEKKKDQGKKICYVSLNGITKTSLIDEAIFKSIHPILGSQGAKLAGQILKGTLKATIRVDLDGDSKSDGNISGGIPKIELPDYLKINDNFILVFDDLERCELKKEEVLGYINYFVEQDNIKTLIVSNEDEIKDNDDYAIKKEKLIGATFSYTEDQNLAIKSIFEEVSNGELKELLIAKIDLITQTFNQVGYKNLRSFKQAVFDFERFYKKEFSGKILLDYKKIRNYAVEAIKKFDIRPDNPEISTKSLSGGNAQKIIVARELGSESDLLIASQPTRGIDIGSIEFIRKNINEYKSRGKGILLVSAELEEVMSLSDRIIVMYEGGIAGILSAEEATEENVGFLMTGGNKAHEYEK